MGKNQLVPVVKPDINGKMVTRHVLMDQSVKDFLTFPAPALNVNPVVPDGYAHRLASALVSEPSDEYIIVLAKTQEKKAADLAEAYSEALPERAIKDLHDRVSGFTAEEKNIFEHAVPSLFNDFLVRSINDEDTEKMFYGVLNNVDLFTTFHPVAFGSDYLLQSSTAALRQADHLGIDPRSSSEHEQRLYRFLLFKAIIKDERFIDTMEAYEKANWLEDHEHLLFPHASAIRQRDADWEWMKELANPEAAPSLSEGTL